MITLYALPISGYCSKVRSVLRLKQIPFEECEPTGGHYSSEAWREAMPPGSIPAIRHAVDGETFSLFDSEAIALYLDDLSPEPPLLSNDRKQRARQHALSQFHNGRLEPTVRALFPLVKSAGFDAAQAAAEAFQSQVTMLQRVAADGPWIGGSALSLPDCAVPFTLHMGKDILARLRQPIGFAPEMEDYLRLVAEHPVLGDEIVANRTVVSGWLDGFIAKS